MQLDKTTVKIRCEMGACKNPAAYTVRPARVGIRSRFHICRDCLMELGGLIAAELPAKAEVPAAAPKSIETMKSRQKAREK